MVLFAPVDIILQRHPWRTRQPDVLFIHKDKLSNTGLDAIEELQILEIAPDLVIEVLSSSDPEKMLSTDWHYCKRDFYLRLMLGNRTTATD